MDHDQNKTEFETPAAPETAPAEDGTYFQTQSEHFTERPYEAPRETPVYSAPSYAPYYQPAPAPEKPKKKKGGLIALLCIALFLVGVVVCYLLITWLNTNPFGIGARNDKGSRSAQEELADSNTVDPGKDLTNRSFAPVYGDDKTVYSAAEIYKNSIDAIVGVSTEISQRNIFGQEATYAVSGTGFFISTEGYLMTNCHLVESAKKITVTLYDGTEYEATLVG